MTTKAQLVEYQEKLRADRERLRAERDALRTALAGLVAVSLWPQAYHPGADREGFVAAIAAAEAALKGGAK